MAGEEVDPFTTRGYRGLVAIGGDACITEFSEPLLFMGSPWLIRSGLSNAESSDAVLSDASRLLPAVAVGLGLKADPLTTSGLFSWAIAPLIGGNGTDGSGAVPVPTDNAREWWPAGEGDREGLRRRRSRID